MDYLFFNVGECDDRLREREFYLVPQCGGIGEARARLSAYFLSDADTAHERIDDWEVFLQADSDRGIQFNFALIGSWQVGNVTLVY